MKITDLLKGRLYRFIILEDSSFPSYVDIPKIIKDCPICDNVLYPEDIKIGSAYFGSPVKAIS